MQRIGAAVPFPGAAANDDLQASQRANEEAAALAKAAAEAERKVSLTLTTQFGVAHWPQQHSAN